MSGIAPGAYAWHKKARQLRRSAVDWRRLFVGEKEDHWRLRARAEAAEAKLAMARAAWSVLDVYAIGEQPKQRDMAEAEDARSRLARALEPGS